MRGGEAKPVLQKGKGTWGDAGALRGNEALIVGGTTTKGESCAVPGERNGKKLHMNPEKIPKPTEAVKVSVTGECEIKGEKVMTLEEKAIRGKREKVSVLPGFDEEPRAGKESRRKAITVVRNR